MQRWCALRYSSVSINGKALVYPTEKPAIKAAEATGEQLSA